MTIETYREEMDLQLFVFGQKRVVFGCFGCFWSKYYISEKWFIVRHFTIYTETRGTSKLQTCVGKIQFNNLLLVEEFRV